MKNTYKLLLEYDQGTPNVRLKRKQALRGEVMLSDIATVYPHHPFTLERVLEILLIDFITKYERGEAKNIIVMLNGTESK